MVPKAINDYKGVFKRLLESGPAEGDIAEFGVFGGGSTVQLAELAPERRIWAFDTFQGLPTEEFQPELDGPLNPPGKFNPNGVPKVLLENPNIIPMVGQFKYTLPKVCFMTDFALVYIDCDYYQSFKDVFKYLPDMLLPGSGLVFDDYSRLTGAKQAIDEFIAKWNLKLETGIYTIWNPS